MSPQERNREIKELLAGADEAGRRARRHAESAARHLRSAAARVNSRRADSNGGYVSKATATGGR